MRGGSFFRKGGSTRLLCILDRRGNAKTTCACGLFVLDRLVILFRLFVAVAVLARLRDGMPDGELGSIESSSQPVNTSETILRRWVVRVNAESGVEKLLGFGEHGIGRIRIPAIRHLIPVFDLVGIF